MTSQSTQSLAAEVRDFASFVAAEKLFARVLHCVRSDAGLLAPLKGVSLQQCVYEVPHERPLTDVDVLVHPRVYRRVLNRLTEQEGFDVLARGSTGHTLVHPQEALALDLHHRLFPHGMFRLDSEALFERASWRKTDGVEHRQLASSDLYASLLGHFVKGRLGREHTVHLRDLARVPQALELSPEDVATHLVEHGLARAAHTVLPLVWDAEQDLFTKHLLAHLRIGPVTRVAATLLVRHREQVDAWGVSRRLWPYAFDSDAKRGVLNATRHASLGALRRVANVPRPFRR